MNLTLRTLHTYVGIFIAPTVLFFALTGSLQLFNLHEAHGSYHPLALIEQLGNLHKDQVLRSENKHEPPHHDADEAEHGPPHDDADHDHPAPGMATYALKWFCLVVALGLAFAIGMGLCIGLSQPRRKRIGWSLLAAGAAIPVLLVFLT